MYEINFRHWLWQLPLVISASLINLSSHPATAQITPDSTLGSESSIVTPNINVKGSPADLINGGAIRNTNLFHSFSEFNVSEGQRLYFANPTGIDNILTRVTGGNASNILGLLGVNGPANLFLINPNGIIFGQNSRLDIPGSFFATTANSFTFSNGTEFSATNPQAPPLLTISVPNGIQFNNSQPAPIVSQGKLEVGQNFTLAAGNLNLSGQLQAGGNLTLQATDTVRIRDTVTEPFVAYAGRDLLIQGNQGIDIFVLNHPNSGFYSGGDMILRSANTVGGDAHYWTNGNFRIEKLDESPGKLFSPDDPVIRASGDVILDSYVGSSLYIFAGGKVEIRDGVWITGSDPALDSQPTLDIRAGMNPLDIGTPLGMTGSNFTVINGLNYSSSSSADIKIGTVVFRTFSIAASIAVLNNDLPLFLANSSPLTGTVNLTNQYEPNTLLPGGNIEVSGGSLGGGIFSNGGSATIESRSNITLKNSILDTSSSSGAGAVSLISTTGTIALENNRIISKTNSGTGGDITLQARAVELNHGSAIIAGTTGSGEGGKILISADSVTVTGTGNSPILQSVLDRSISATTVNNSSLKDGIFAITSGDGQAGDLVIDTKQLTLQNQAGVFAGTLGAGDGGNLSINTVGGSVTVIDSGVATVTSTTSTGNAGNLNVDARNGNVEIIGNSPKPRSGFTSVTLGAGDTGSLTLKTQTLNIIDWAGIATETTSGKAGDLTIIANTMNITGNNLSGPGILSSTKGIANGGDVNITAVDIKLKDGGALTTQTRGSGNAGNLNIFTSRFTVQGDDTGVITSGAKGSTGNGGDLTLIATDFVQLIGNEPGSFNPTLEWARDEIGGRGSLHKLTGLTTGTSNSGDAGDLKIVTGKLIIQDGAGVATSTLDRGQGGNLTVIADTVEMQGKGILATTAFNTGNAGNLKLTTGELTLRDGGLISADTIGSGNAGDLEIATRQLIVQNGSRIGVSTGSAGNAGNLNINASEFVEVAGKSNNGQTASGLFAQGETGSTGKAGDLTIATGKLIIRDGGQVTVSNQGLGDAGNINIKSDTVLMNNQGQIVAATASGEGGNINLQVGSLLLMRHNSQISTTAGNNGNGGNININAPFIVGVPKENSDITANAFFGRGGRIQITTQGIFGLKFRSNLTPKSDITASSDFGVNGVVQITTLGIDPSQGLNSLPTNFQPPKVAEGCQVYGKRATNPLITTGSGGMPLNPRDVLSSNGVLDDLGSPVNQMATTTITEAQGMTKNAEGQLVLVAKIPESCPGRSPI